MYVVFGLNIVYTELVHPEGATSYSIVRFGLGLSAISAASWVACWWISNRFVAQGQFRGLPFAAAPLVVWGLPLLILVVAFKRDPPLPTQYARAKVSRPLWMACAYALDSTSRLNVDRLTVLIDGGKVAGVNLAEALKDRGCIDEALADDTSAIEDYSKVLELEPDDAETYFIRGRTYGNSQKYEQALADYSAALRLKPEDAEAYYRRGHVFEEESRHREAVEDYDTCLRLDPTNIAAYEMRAISYVNLGNAREATHDKESAARLRATSLSSIWTKRAAGEWE